ncbi:hypothetical protein M378DRAFT_591413 [Amanita muscaria Koide BX008]|uniref:Uncharacterized protein n=1 Tax=Amanita muscaria (strain Koide BX008) TaxID=946122 RepID=A0A0C2SNC7_AMAMK|nr:hypothetical protein M378DRAFT_591413 [Amanita muscaria Koide BX008]
MHKYSYFNRSSVGSDTTRKRYMFLCQKPESMMNRGRRDNFYFACLRSGKTNIAMLTVLQNSQEFETRDEDICTFHLEALKLCAEDRREQGRNCGMTGLHISIRAPHSPSLYSGGVGHQQVGLESGRTDAGLLESWQQLKCAQFQSTEHGRIGSQSYGGDVTVNVTTWGVQARAVVWKAEGKLYAWEQGTLFRFAAITLFSISGAGRHL